MNNGNANKGGGQNKKSDGSGEYQPNDPRKETTTKTYPTTPSVTPDHRNDDVVDQENKMNYTTDPESSGRGSSDKKSSPNHGDGSADGKFTPKN